MPPDPSTPSPALIRVAIIVSRYNATVTDQLLKGALDVATQRGSCHVDVWEAPGAFELATLCDHALATKRYQGAVTLGCIIRGETTHDQHIASAVANGVVEVSLRHRLPVTLGVLTVNTPEQAVARSGGDLGNKGADAMGALLDVLDVIAKGISYRDGKGTTFSLSSTINDKASGKV